MTLTVSETNRSVGDSKYLLIPHDMSEVEASYVRLVDYDTESDDDCSSLKRDCLNGSEKREKSALDVSCSVFRKRRVDVVEKAKNALSESTSESKKEGRLYSDAVQTGSNPGVVKSVDNELVCAEVVVAQKVGFGCLIFTL